MKGNNKSLLGNWNLNLANQNVKIIKKKQKTIEHVSLKKDENNVLSI